MYNTFRSQVARNLIQLYASLLLQRLVSYNIGSIELIERIDRAAKRTNKPSDQEGDDDCRGFFNAIIRKDLTISYIS